MVDYNELRKILNNSKMNIKHYQNGKTAVTDSKTFRGMSTSALDDAIELVEKSTKEETVKLAQKCGIPQVDTLKTVTERANRNIDTVIDCFSKPSVDAKDLHQTMIRDSIFNGRWNLGNMADPTRNNMSVPNIYISPYEANSLYSQKGIFETIIKFLVLSIGSSSFIKDGSFPPKIDIAFLASINSSSAPGPFIAMNLPPFLTKGKQYSERVLSLATALAVA